MITALFGLRCTSCHYRIEGKYIRKWHRPHAILCEHCSNVIPEEYQFAQYSQIQVLKFFQRKNLKYPGAPYPVLLVSQKVLESESTVRRPNSLGLCKKTNLGDGNSREQKVEILILEGLTEEHSRAVLAHELGHAWLFCNDYPDLPRTVEEGVAELFEYLWLTEQQTEISRYRIKAMESNQDQIYGVGFRAAKQALKKKPLHKLLRHVYRYRQLPVN